MSNSPQYFRTWDLEMRQRTHLEGNGDYTLCGLDTSGDDLVHSKDPEALGSGNHRVTCDHCLQLIEIVRRHLKAKQPALSRQLAERQWQPIESAPRDGSWILVYGRCPHSKEMDVHMVKWTDDDAPGGTVMVWGIANTYDIGSGWEQVVDATHWMRLSPPTEQPPGPEGEGEDKKP